MGGKGRLLDRPEEEEFAYILPTFPLVTDAAKIAAHKAFRNVEKGLVK